MKYFLPAGLITIAIFWLSIVSSDNLPETFQDLFSADKLNHAIAYATLTLSYYWGYQKSIGKVPERWLFFIGWATAAYGILMEVIQYTFFPNRYFEVLDILANIMGIVISYAIYKFFNKTTAP